MNTMQTASDIDEREPLRPAGIAELSYETVHDVASLTAPGNHRRMPLFHRASVPHQYPLAWEAEIDPRIVQEHTRYVEPPEVFVYALDGATVWRDGVVVVGDQFFLPQDCYPDYMRPIASDKGYSLFPGPSREGRAHRIDVNGAAACILHPNLVYGHFLLEILPRFYLQAQLNALGCHAPVYISRTVPSWVKEFVRLYFRRGEVVWYNSHLSFVAPETLLVPSMMQTGHHLHPAFNWLVADLLHRVGEPSRPKNESRFSRVYLSRRLYTNAQRVENGEEVERLMSDLGFEIVHPHTLPFAEQVHIMRSADIVVGEYGSAMHSTLFAREGTRVLCIDFHNAYQSAIARVRRQRVAYIPPADGEFHHWALSRAAQRVFMVDCGALRLAVEELLAGLDAEVANRGCRAVSSGGRPASAPNACPKESTFPTNESTSDPDDPSDDVDPIVVAEEEVAIDPTNVDLRTRLGWLLLGRGEARRAEQAFRDAWNLAPDNPLLGHALSFALIRQGRAADAVAAFEKAGFDEASYHDQVHYGHLLASGGEFSRAEAAFVRALQIDPSELRVHEALVHVLDRQNRVDEALAAIETAISLDPANASALDYRERLLTRMAAAAHADEEGVRNPAAPLDAVQYRLDKAT